MQLIVVTPPEYFEAEDALINSFFAEGLELLHIRKTIDDPERFRLLLEGINQEYYPLISVHQHHEIARESGLQRLHFKEAERKKLLRGDVDRLLSEGMHLSSSVHDLNDLSDLYGFDYVFYGPVFNSISKADYHSVLPDGFVLDRYATSVFAIGGIKAEKLQQLKHMNFDGAAVLGSLWHQEVSPVLALKKLLLLMNKLNKESTNDHR